MKKKHLKKEIEFYKKCLLEASKANVDISLELEETKEKLAISNQAVRVLSNANENLAKYIEALEKQLEQQDKAIVRKDEQFLGLRKAYEDEIINNK